MPLHYHTGALSEHHLVRRAAGLFDISHMGRLELRGADAAGALDYLVTSDILGLSEGLSAYGLLCREDGTTIDDVFVYRFPDRFLVVVNAANRDRDVAWIRDKLAGLDGDTQFADRSEELSMIALQGPDALRIADGLSDGAAGRMPRFGCEVISIGGISAICGRTGYTGEDGVELFPEAGDVEPLWNACFEYAEKNSVELGPCGLAARDSLRFEPGFHLYGHELTDDTTPVEARLKWACHFDRPFVGRDAILARAEEGPKRRLATVVMEDRAVPREGYRVLDDQGQPVGEVVSGMYAPTADCYAANIYVERGLSKVGSTVGIDVRGREKRAKVIKRPLYTPSYKGE